MEVRHITEFIASQEKPRLKESSGVVAYHDPCYLARHAGSKSPRGARVVDEPRRVLSWIPGLKTVELRHRGRWTWCVGECGGLIWSFPELAHWRAEKLLREVEMMNVEALVTASPMEQLHLRETAKRAGIKVAIQDISELLASSLSR
ncbi:hypothetical protein HRbin01_00467 [archaeon HR01]|nr:hypothetical protein HRbin01_00467 [archaeon HR01]